MFLKIFRHAFVRPMKTNITLLAVSLAVGIVTAIGHLAIKNMEISRTILALRTILSLMPTAIGFLSFAVFILTFSAFEKSVSTDEAYFTFTLPATAGEQLGARVLSILSWVFISSIVTSISSGLIVACSTVKDVGSTLLPIEINFDSALLIIEAFILGIVFELAILIHIVFLILLERDLTVKLRSKGSKAIIFLIVFVEIVFFFIIVVAVILAGVLEGVSSSLTIHVILWVFIILSALFGAGSYYLSYRSIRRTNLA